MPGQAETHEELPAWSLPSDALAGSAIEADWPSDGERVLALARDGLEDELLAHLVMHVSRERCRRAPTCRPAR
jgi:hypothetical protein